MKHVGAIFLWNLLMLFSYETYWCYFPMKHFDVIFLWNTLMLLRNSASSFHWLSSSIFTCSFVLHQWHLLSSPQYDVSDHTNHIFSVRIWSWQHVSVIISSFQFIFANLPPLNLSFAQLCVAYFSYETFWCYSYETLWSYFPIIHVDAIFLWNISILFSWNWHWWCQLEDMPISRMWAQPWQEGKSRNLEAQKSSMDFFQNGSLTWIDFLFLSLTIWGEI